MQGNADIDVQLQSLLATGADWTQALSLVRKDELRKAEMQTKEHMLSLGRCPVCTLALPCLHYSQPAQLPRLRKVPVRASSLGQRKRLKLLEKLDLYRQDKINKAIQRLEREQQVEETKRAEATLREHRRRQRQAELQRLLVQRKPTSSSPPSVPKQVPRLPRAYIVARLTKALDQVLPPLSLDVGLLELPTC